MNRALPRLLVLLFALSGVGHASAAPTPDTLAQGRKVYERWCASCHGPGQHTPGTMALYFKYQGQKQPMLEHRDDLSPEFIAYFVRHGISIMPFFRKTEISDADLARLSAYLLHAGAQPKPPLPPFPPPPPPGMQP